MAQVWLKTSAAAVTALALSLTGCFEITKDATFRENGEVQFELGIALAPELSALLSNPIVTKQIGGQGLTELFGNCGESVPAAKSLPDGVRAVGSRRGKRGDMEMCTWTVDVSDPVAAAAGVRHVQSRRPLHMPSQEISMVRLEGRPGYRMVIALEPLKLPRGSEETQNVGKAVLDAMFLNRHISFSISARRIERTNGALAADGRSVTWRIPIATAFDPGRETPLTIEADILYK